MKKNKGNLHSNGSITVFLSLVLVLILSLVMTIIEGARQTTARVIAVRSLSASMDSVLAEFYGPLMEEYHLLGLDISYGETSSKVGDVEQRMEEYMSYTLNPRQGLSGTGDSRELYGISLDSVQVQDKTSLLDHKGQIFIHEVTEYMKYETLGDVAEFFLDKVSLLEQPKKVSVLYDEKVKLEEKLVTIDEGILALMKYIDGLSTGRKGLKIGKGGKLKTESSFAKRIIYEDPSMETTGINNEKVFFAIQSKYMDPSEAFTIIYNSIERVEQIKEAVVGLESRIDSIKNSKSEKKETLKEQKETLSNIKKEDKEGKKSVEASIKQTKEEISDLEDEIDSVYSDIKVYNSEEGECISAITSNGYKLQDLVSGSLTATEQAIIELEQIIITAEEAKPLIKDYEKLLDKEKEGLSDDICLSLEEGLAELKRYQLDNSGGYDFPGMLEILNSNYKVLSSCITSINSGYDHISLQDFSGAKLAYNKACEELLAYKTKGLNINYSTLVVTKDDSPDLVDSVKDLIKGGIMGLVVDTKSVSNKEIDTNMLPSILDMLTEEDQGFSFTKLLKGMKIGGKDSKMGGLFGSFGNYSIGSLLGKAGDEIAEGILFQAYIDDHFHRFPVNEEETKGRKPSVLAYEREYILCGKSTDKDNLEAVIGKLLLIRTILNFTTILGDKEKWEEAKTIATTLVGFTGLPILVAITQGILIILLAFASAMIDTCALLIGKELPILKKEVDLKFPELLTLTRNNILKKAEDYKEDKGFSYNDYLTLFLFITNKRKRSFRMMGLIQENINIRYDTEFNLQNCIFAYKAEAEFHIKPLFTTLSFMEKYNNKSNFKKPLIVQAEYSY